MRKACIFVNGIEAGLLEELTNNKYRLSYLANYHGQPISLTLPVTSTPYEFEQFPPFFEGLLPEGVMLEALLRQYKIDRYDYFRQLLQVGHDVVGAVTVEEVV